MFFAGILLLAVWPIFGQGGKAEPQRIELRTGRTGATLTGTLSNSQEKDFVLAASEGQKLTLRIADPALFDYRVYCPEADFDTEFDSSPTTTIDLPASCDYLLFVRKKMVKRPRTARFTLNIYLK